jgi:glycosyltransferase involved in cell wall biosynthesis
MPCFERGYMARDELAGLMAVSDSYISLHRSEGFGLGIAEAMALGNPSSPRGTRDRRIF